MVLCFLIDGITHTARRRLPITHRTFVLMFSLSVSVGVVVMCFVINVSVHTARWVFTFAYTGRLCRYSCVVSLLGL